MKKFNSYVQELKFNVLKEVAAAEWRDDLLQAITDIPKMIITTDRATMRCCVYKERAIVAERVKLAVGLSLDKTSDCIMQVIDIACDGCPVVGYDVTNACRGCLSHQCVEVCPRAAIEVERTDNNRQCARIDKNKCIECGKCEKACPYHAIANYKRPCMTACAAGAIAVNKGDNGAPLAAVIDNGKCTNCGACMNACPFGAIMDKSYIISLIDILRRSEGNKNFNVYAVIAPAIEAYLAKSGINSRHIVTALKQIGFHDVAEAAAGADIVARLEANEISNSDVYITTSCCPAFVQYIKKQFPKAKGHISHTKSPMEVTGDLIKEKDPTAKVVFIGPCTAKKYEVRRNSRSIDGVITFFELDALLASRNIDPTTLGETPYCTSATSYGTGFAKSGGVAAAVVANAEQSITAVTANGLAACKRELTKACAGFYDKNSGIVIEGMACEGGCVCGAGQ